jgi:hypothetical protein
MTSLPFALTIPFLTSISAGKVTGCVIPLMVRFPVTFLFSPLIDATLVITIVEMGNFSTSKKSGPFK